MGDNKNLNLLDEKIIFRTFCVMIALLIVLTAVVFTFLPGAEKKEEIPKNDHGSDIPASQDQDKNEITKPESNISGKPVIFESTEDTKTFGKDEINAEYGVLCDIDSGKIIVSSKANERIYPASMTKIMTLIVAIENIEDLNDDFTFTASIINPLVSAGASRAGFEVGEKVKIIDLLYGAALPSGGDATAALAIYVAGSESEFAKLMNAKAASLGLAGTNFVNASGLHNDNHYTTPSDMASILAYAVQNETYLKVTSAEKYTTTKTLQHPNGIVLYSGLFVRMKDVESPGTVTVKSGKTGYTDEAKYCLATYAVSKSGRRYILVTAKGDTEGYLADGSKDGRYQPIFDLVYVYNNYAT